MYIPQRRVLFNLRSGQSRIRGRIRAVSTAAPICSLPAHAVSWPPIKELIVRPLLVVTAVLEGATGVALVTLASRLATLLLGAPLDAPAAVTLARVAGLALLALAVTCWRARDDGQSQAAKGLVGGMVVYHIGVAIAFAYAAIGLELSGVGLWPTALFHVAMTVWCVTALR
jgi:hypothetical protein